MTYGDFIKRLNKGIEGWIKGYFEEGDGCLFYLSRDDTIYVPAMYVERREQELLEFLRDAIREGVVGRHAVAVADNTLALLPCSREKAGT